MRGSGPVRDFLKSWQPILPRPKFFQQQQRYEYQGIPANVSREQAIEVIAATPWAQDAGYGIARLILGEAAADTPEFRNIQQRWARALAEGMIRRTPMAPPAPAATAAPAPRRRRG
jgi:hypothetical protein